MEENDYMQEDWEDETEYCEDCGDEKQFEDCWQCGGEGGRGWDDDLQFEDPLWYTPGDFEICDICEGKGGYYVCHNHKNHKNKSNPQ